MWLASGPKNVKFRSEDVGKMDVLCKVHEMRRTYWRRDHSGGGGGDVER